MAEINEIQLYTLNEYVFESKEDYDAALQEKKGISYLSAKLDLNNTERVKDMYNELIEKHVFSTPVGMDYLKKLRETVLHKDPSLADDLKRIPIPSANHKKKNEADKYISGKIEAELKTMEATVKKTKEKRRVSIFINIGLALAVVAMVVISNTSSNVNILNYEEKLQDKYASWAEELTAREKAVKEKEAALDGSTSEEETTMTSADGNE